MIKYILFLFTTIFLFMGHSYAQTLELGGAKCASVRVNCAGKHLPSLNNKLNAVDDVTTISYDSDKLKNAGCEEKSIITVNFDGGCCGLGPSPCQDDSPEQGRSWSCTGDAPFNSSSRDVMHCR